jgi:hypothetical protein
MLALKTTKTKIKNEAQEYFVEMDAIFKPKSFA